MALYNRRKSIQLLLVLTFLIQIGASPVFAQTSGSSELGFNAIPSDVTNETVVFPSRDLTIDNQPFSSIESFSLEEVTMVVDDSYYQQNSISSTSYDQKKDPGDGDREDLEKLTARLIKELEERLGVSEELRSLEQGKTESSLTMSTSEFSMSSSALPSQAEYNALMAIYQMTGGANWINKTGWSTADPNVVQSVFGWSGVTVDYDGHVTGIHLNGNNLTGTLPESIRDLDYLRSLLLPLNNLSGQLPDVFHEMASLKEIAMDRNQLSGNIPQSIGYSSTLEAIQLAENSLTGQLPSYLNNLTSLRYLILHENQLTGPIPSSIGSLSSLEMLYLYSNDLTGSIPASIGTLSNLKFLQLFQNRISGTIPASVGSLQQLIAFSIHDNEIGGAIPSTIGNLSNMELFFAYNNKLTGQLPTTLGDLKKVTNFLLLSNQLTGPIPTQVGDMTNLQYLNLTENKISGTIPAQLGNLTNMYLLRLDYNQLTGQIPSTLCSLSNLVLFYAEMNQLTGEVPLCLLTNGPGQFRISHNYYSFTDLVNITQYWPQPNYYSPQRSNPELTTYSISGTGTITLTTVVGKNLGSPSSYQWYKNGNTLTGASPTNDSVTVNCPISGDGFDCSGNYIADVTNSGYPTIVILAAGKSTETNSDTLRILICILFEFDSDYCAPPASDEFVPLQIKVPEANLGRVSSSNWTAMKNSKGIEGVIENFSIDSLHNQSVHSPHQLQKGNKRYNTSS
jgi:Leucine-rich repeat (LRR) protein